LSSVRQTNSVREFHKNKRGSDGFAAYCKPCYAEKPRPSARTRRYGIAIAEYDTLLLKQNGSCDLQETTFYQEGPGSRSLPPNGSNQGHIVLALQFCIRFVGRRSSSHRAGARVFALIASALQVILGGSLVFAAGPTGLHLSAHSSLRLSLVSTLRPKGPRFQLVVSGRQRQARNHLPSAAVHCVRKDEGAALWADSEDRRSEALLTSKGL